MSELPHRMTQTPTEQPSGMVRVASQAEPPSFVQRLVFLSVFIMIVSGLLALTPQLAQKIAYSWNVGVERARADVAKNFLSDHPLAATEQRIVWVAKAVAPSVVGIYAMASPPSGVRGRGAISRLGSGIGSGVIVDSQGYILTNYHVIADADLILVRLSDGREVEAEVVGRDRPADLAVLRIDLDDLEAVSWGDSRHVIVGEQVVAIGSPYDLQQTVTSGIISATERDGTALLTGGTRRGRRGAQEYLQTDAAINLGNSGGALVDMNGKLVGICTAAIYSHSGGNTGIGFAIPSFVAKRIYDGIVSHGEVKYGWLGADLEPVTASQSRRMNQKKPAGAMIIRVQGRSPAMDASLKRGDIVVRWGEVDISDPLHLSHVVLLSKPGTKETVEIFRDGEFLKIDVTVGVRPTDL